MKSIIRLVAVIVGFVLLNVTPSWGQLVNPTVSDTNHNTAGGTDALISVDGTGTGGLNNTAFGFDALAQTTTGDANTATGAEALFFNSTGAANTATGFSALFFNSTGSNNTASGADALFFNTDGSDNTANGVSALLVNTSGARNTAVGRNALFNSTGNKNIGIGYNAGSALSSGNNNIYIGNQGAGVESQTIRIGTAQAQTFMAGIAGVPISLNVNGATMAVDTTTGQLGIAVQFSSARYKQDIVSMGTSSEKVLDLRPVTFAYKDDARAITHYGLIAEEVATVYPDLVTRTASGDVQAVKYQELIPMLLNELQRQRQASQKESAEVATLRKELAELRALVGSRQEK